jgi:hypothetical protein
MRVCIQTGDYASTNEASPRADKGQSFGEQILFLQRFLLGVLSRPFFSIISVT